jgi:hypothetical protein
MIFTWVVFGLSGATLTLLKPVANVSVLLTWAIGVGLGAWMLIRSVWGRRRASEIQ